jgi:hypothetical protein
MIASLCAYLGGEKLGKGTDRTSDVAVVTSSRASQNSTLRASSLLRIDGVGEVSREGPAPVPAGEAGGILDPRGMPTAAANRRRARARREGRRNPHAPGKTEWGRFCARGQRPWPLGRPTAPRMEGEQAGAEASTRAGGRAGEASRAGEVRGGRRHPHALGSSGIRAPVKTSVTSEGGTSGAW